MKPISVRDIDFKVGTVLQTVEDFVVIESMDPNVLEPHLHTRSIRYRGAKTIVNLSQIRGVVVPVVQGGAEPTINAPQLRGEVGRTCLQDICADSSRRLQAGSRSGFSSQA